MESFRIKNIKSFTDSGDIEIRPITVFIGKNSSGKSSLIRFPLVLKQSMKPNFMSPLMLNGDILDYGNYSNVVFNNKKDKIMSFSFTYRIGSFIEGYLSDLKKALNHFGFNLDESTAIIVNVEMKNIIDNNWQQMKVNKFEMGIEEHSFLEVKLISNDFYKVNFMGNEKDHKLSFDGIFPELKKIIFDIGPINLSQPVSIPMALDLLNLTYMYYNNFMRGIQYIGPFRTTPIRNYSFAEGRYTSVGSDGNLAPFILAQKFLQNKEESLDKINAWFNKHLGIELEVRIYDGNKFEILVLNLNTGQKHNLLDVGFGFSQILPVVLQTFFPAEVDHSNYLKSFPKVLVIEQPELHLHTAAQASLADLFIEGIKVHSDTRYLIETHSEFLILRLQRRVAEGTLSPDDVIVYYIEGGQDPEEPSKVHPLEFNRNGEIPDWPEDFFEQDYWEFVAIKKAQKKLKEDLGDA